MVLDDIGTKISAEALADFQFSWKLETSPGNFQYGLIFNEPVPDGHKVTSILDAFITKDWCDAGASGPMSRWSRLPVGINGKPKYKCDDGVPFGCQLKEWNPNKRYSPEQLIEEFQLELIKTPTSYAGDDSGCRPSNPDMTGGVYFPVNNENPVILSLKAMDLYKTPLGSGKHDITCPWVEQHSDAIDSGTAYFEPDDNYPAGGFSCMHSHREKFYISQLLDYLGIEQGYPLRLVVPGWEGNTWVKWLRRIEVGDQPWYHREETSKYTDLLENGKAREFTWVMDAKSVITSPSPELPLRRGGRQLIKGLAWSGRGAIKKVDVSVDGGINWITARLDNLVLPKALTRFYLDWQWDGEEVLLQSRAMDEFGYVQPQIGDLHKARGVNSIYHNNSIQTWLINKNGDVENVRLG